MIAIDKNIILQIFGALMKKPSLLSEKDKYKLEVNDFSNLFEKYIYSAIYNLYKDGAQSISEVDIDNYLTLHAQAKEIFNKNNGIEYLQDALYFADENNFSVYYKRFKKLLVLNALEKQGYDISRFYCSDLLNPKAVEINNAFEELEIEDIFSSLKKQTLEIESKYSLQGTSTTVSADSNIDQLLEDLKKRPDTGAPLQGEFFNTITRGARKSKFYLRSASSGQGKTRLAVADACGLSIPVIFNQNNWEWEWTGAQEKTLFIATEQKVDEVQTIILAFLTGISESKIIINQLTPREETVLIQAVELLKKYKDNLYIVQIPSPSIEQLKGVITQNWLLHNIQNVFFDYIFAGAGLSSSFNKKNLRTDEELGMLSTALKDIATELNIFIMSGTQTNNKSDEQGGIKDASAIRGARSIADKCDFGCMVNSVTDHDLEMLSTIIEQIGMAPNQVIDVYKVRRGPYNRVKIWSKVDLGTGRKIDLLVTDDKYKQIPNFEILKFIFDDQVLDSETQRLLDDLNNGVSILGNSPDTVDESEKISLEKVQILESAQEYEKTTNIFKGLI